jgi:hypothetical protein
MKRVKQAESREAGMPNALASAKSQSRSKSSRTLPHNPAAAGGANRLEQQRRERLLTGAGSRISPSGRERSDSESSPSSGSAIGGATRASPREGSGGGSVGMLPPAADYGEQRSAQQLAWWRGTAPRERSASAAPKPKRSGGAGPPPRRG